jgi:hypothetical protein
MSFKKVLFLLFSLSLAFLHAAEFDIGAIKITPARNNQKFAAEELQKHLSLAGAPK